MKNQRNRCTNRLFTIQRWFAAVLTLAMIFSLIPLGSVHADEEGPWMYTVNGDEVTVERYKGAEANVTIPETLRGKPVKKIGFSCFESATIESVAIPRSVNEISYRSFDRAATLKTVSFYGTRPVGEWLKFTDILSFAECTSLPMESVNNILAEGVKDVYACLFVGCTGVTGELIIPSTVDTISGESFKGTRITKVSFADYTKKVGFDTRSWRVFGENPVLTTIELPPLDKIPDGVFVDIQNLQKVTFHQVAPPAIEAEAFNHVMKPDCLFLVPAGADLAAWKTALVNGGAPDTIIVKHLGDTVKATFDSVGGSPVTAQWVRVGDYVNYPGSPVLDSYLFSGWHLGEKRYDFTTPVKEDITLKAKWKLGLATEPRSEGADVLSIVWGKIVTFDSNGGSPVTAQWVPKGRYVNRPENPTKDGYHCSGWYLGEEKYDFTTPVTAGITLKAHWMPMIIRPKEPIKYTTTVIATATVTFDSDGGSPVSTQNVDEGNLVDKPGNPTKEGYSFSGWYLGEELYDFVTPVTKNITLKAAWLPLITSFPTRKMEFASLPLSYTVTFDADGGSAVEAQMVVSGKPAVKPSDPAKTGFTFAGWQLDGKNYDFAAPVTSAITLKGVWNATAPDKFAIAVSDGTVDKTTAAPGEIVTLTASAAPIGKAFDKWVLKPASLVLTAGNAEGSIGSFTMPGENVTATATYKEKAAEASPAPPDTTTQKPPVPVQPEKKIVAFVIGQNRHTVNVKEQEEVKTMDAAPFVQDGRTMIPLRYAGEAMGAQITWDPQKRQATFTMEGNTGMLTLGSKILMINGESMEMDTVPVIAEGRLYLPIKWLGIALGYDASSPLHKEGNEILWDQSTKTVKIIKGQ